MVKKLELCEFVRPNALEDIIMEGYDWSDDSQANKQDARLSNIQQKQESETISQQGAILKNELLDFVANQLPNVKLQANRLSLGDMTVKNNTDLADTISKDELKPWFHMLCASVRGFLSGKDHNQVASLLHPFGGNIVQLVRNIASEVPPEKIQQAVAQSRKGNLKNGTY